MSAVPASGTPENPPALRDKLADLIAEGWQNRAFSRYEVADSVLAFPEIARAFAITAAAEAWWHSFASSRYDAVEEASEALEKAIAAGLREASR